jgi:hypothetical protein
MGMVMPYLPYRYLAKFVASAVWRVDSQTRAFSNAISSENGCEDPVVTAVISQLTAGSFNRRHLAGKRSHHSQITRNRLLEDTGVGKIDLVAPSSEWKGLVAAEFKVLKPKENWKGPASARRRINDDLVKLAMVHHRRAEVRGAMVVVGLGWRQKVLRDFVLSATRALDVDSAWARLQNRAPAAVVVVRVPSQVVVARLLNALACPC